MTADLKKIGIFGGSFDPIHIGHLIAVRSIKEHLKLDEIIFIPANISPLKSRHGSSALDRLQMTKLAVSDNKDYSVSAYEINKGGKSYTVDTLRYFSQIYPNSELTLILGLDSIASLDKWSEYSKIPEFCKLVAAVRPGYRKQLKSVLPVEVIQTPLVDISSSNIRERVAQKMEINYLVPPKVMDYIFANNLYSDVNLK